MDNTDSDRDVDSSPDLAKRRNERAYLALYLAINGNIGRDPACCEYP